MNSLTSRFYNIISIQSLKSETLAIIALYILQLRISKIFLNFKRISPLKHIYNQELIAKIFNTEKSISKLIAQNRALSFCKLLNVQLYY